MPDASGVVFETCPSPDPKYAGVDNLVELVEKVVKERGAKECMGERTVLEVHDLGNGLEKLSLSPEYTWCTFEEFGERVLHTACGLRSLVNLKGKEVVTIYAETKKDWVTIAHA